MIEVRVPDEQEGTKAVVRAWLKRIGDAVAENDPLVELETDKVTQEVPAPAAGVLAEIILGDADQAGAAVPSTDEDDLVADDGGRPRGAGASEGRIRYPATLVQPVDPVRGDGADVATLRDEPAHDDGLTPVRDRHGMVQGHGQVCTRCPAVDRWVIHHDLRAGLSVAQPAEQPDPSVQHGRGRLLHANRSILTLPPGRPRTRFAGRGRLLAAVLEVWHPVRHSCRVGSVQGVCGLFRGAVDRALLFRGFSHRHGSLLARRIQQGGDHRIELLPIIGRDLARHHLVDHALELLGGPPRLRFVVLAGSRESLVHPRAEPDQPEDEGLLRHPGARRLGGGRCRRPRRAGRGGDAQRDHS